MKTPLQYPSRKTKVRSNKRGQSATTQNSVSCIINAGPKNSATVVGHALKSPPLQPITEQEKTAAPSQQDVQNRDEDDAAFDVSYQLSELYDDVEFNDYCEDAEEDEEPIIAATRTSDDKVKEDDQKRVDSAQKCCTVCGIDISTMHYLQQVSHVKQCMAGHGKTKPNTTTSNQPVPAIKQQQQSIAPSAIPSTVEEWLTSLNLPQYIDVFLEHEVDMMVVHVLSDVDFAEIGVSCGLHRRTLLDAGKKIGSRLASMQQKNNNTRGITPGKQSTLPQQVPLIVNRGNTKQQQRQQIDTFTLGVPPQPSNTRVVPPKEPIATDNVEKNSSTLTKEQQLLQRLYSNTVPTTAAAANNEDNYDDMRPTPALPLHPNGTTSIAAAKPSSTNNNLVNSAENIQNSNKAVVQVTPSRSLWTSAARCIEVTAGLDARLLAKSNPSTNPGSIGGGRNAQGNGQAGMQQERLYRGGLSYNRNDEQVALKRMKLEALKQELKAQEESVAELRGMITDLEAEIGS